MVPRIAALSGALLSLFACTALAEVRAPWVTTDRTVDCSSFESIAPYDWSIKVRRHRADPVKEGRPTQRLCPCGDVQIDLKNEIESKHSGPDASKPSGSQRKLRLAEESVRGSSPEGKPLPGSDRK